jgi:hypothetical protein
MTSGRCRLEPPFRLRHRGRSHQTSPSAAQGQAAIESVGVARKALGRGTVASGQLTFQADEAHLAQGYACLLTNSEAVKAPAAHEKPRTKA